VVKAYEEEVFDDEAPACASRLWSSARSMFSSAWREEVVIAVEEAVEVGMTSGREEEAVDDAEVVDEVVEVAVGTMMNAL
jgi:hypothetical protein